MKPDETQISEIMIEETEKEEVKKEPSDTQSESDLVNIVKAEYEEKIKNIIEGNNKKLSERDKVIKELINGSQSEPARENIETLIDELNEKRARQYKY